MLDVASVSALVAAGGVLVGVVLAYLEIRSLVRTRQTDLVIRLYSTSGTMEFLKARRTVMNLECKNYNDYVKKYGESEAVNEVGAFFEGIGVLLNRGLIDIGLCSDLFHLSIVRTWEKVKPIVEGARKHFNQPKIYEWYENLYNELQKREQTLQARH